MSYPLISDSGITKNICKFCGKEFQKKDDQQKYCCQEHQAKAANIRQQDVFAYRQYQKVYREKIRDKVFSLFGSQCQRCGEADPIVLCIDHIEPIGKARKKITQQIFHEILKDPTQVMEKYQLLYHNCNWRKMMENNEHAIAGRAFAYQHEVDLLSFKVKLLEDKLNQKQSTQPMNQKTQLTERQIEEIIIEETIHSNMSTLKTVKGCLDVVAMCLFLRESGIEISSWKAYNIK